METEPEQSSDSIETSPPSTAPGLPNQDKQPSMSSFSFRRIVKRLLETDRKVHARIENRFPKTVGRFDRALLFFVDGFLAHPLFGVLLALVLVLLAAAGLDKVVLVSVAAAWLVAFLWLARSKLIRKLTILSRLTVLLIIGSALAFIGRSFGIWALSAHRIDELKSTRPIVTTTTAPPAKQNLPRLHRKRLPKKTLKMP